MKSQEMEVSEWCNKFCWKCRFWREGYLPKPQVSRIILLLPTVLESGQLQGVDGALA